MGQYTSYYLYQKFEQRGEQEAIPVYPNVYSIDADGTRERVVKIQDDPQCGYDPPIKPIYKWVNIPITQDYICDDCPTYQTRWVRTDETICSGTPTPTVKKLVANYSDGTTREVECNSSGTLTTSETKPSGYEYSSMTSAVIENCVQSIGAEALRNCTSLTSVTISNSVTTIDYWAFGGCSGLTSVTIPNSVTSIGYAAFAHCSGLTSATISNSLTRIGTLAFWSCRSLTSVAIPNSVTSIGDGAFSDCSGLTSINIPNSVTNIGERVFSDCTSLTSVTIGNSVTNIDGWAFLNCSGLTGVTVLATTPPSLGTDVFDYTNDCPLLVVASSLNAYKEAWPQYASRIQAIP